MDVEVCVCVCMCVFSGAVNIFELLCVGGIVLAPRQNFHTHQILAQIAFRSVMNL